MNPMKRMELSRNVEKALDCADKNTYEPIVFRTFRKYIWLILSKYIQFDVKASLIKKMRLNYSYHNARSCENLNFCYLV